MMHRLFQAGPAHLLIAACCAALAACRTTAPDGETASTPPGTGGTEGAVDVSFLVSMTWNEAKTISAQHLEVPPFYKVAADEVRVLRSDETGRPLRVRARGHVFMQVDFQEQLTALGQEAYIRSDGELILRGKPLLKRGRSLVEGLSDTTVFYIKGTHLEVIGKHRLTKQNALEPAWSRSWKEGPNPLLPELSPEDVTRMSRGNPFLPPVDAESPAPPRDAKDR
jgi:hypothetical protein